MMIRTISILAKAALGAMAAVVAVMAMAAAVVVVVATEVEAVVVDAYRRGIRRGLPDHDSLAPPQSDGAEPLRHTRPTPF